jgi:TPR repeat protein
MPEESLPAANSCDYEHPERTVEECRGWAATVTLDHNDVWDRIGREMFGRLCQSGSGQDCAFAADLVSKGIGGPADVALEQQYRDEACRLGVAEECGVDVARRGEIEKAERERLVRECRDRKGVSCYEHGSRLWEQKQDPAALDYLEKACRLGTPSSCGRAATVRDALRGAGPKT